MSSVQSNNLICPHCGFECQYGVRVCRGCQAEILYGPTFGESIGMGCVGGIIGIVGLTILISLGVVLMVILSFKIDVKPSTISTGSQMVWSLLSVCAPLSLIIMVIVGFGWASRIWKTPRFVRHYRHS